MEDYFDKSKYPKIVIMTQTREKEIYNLNCFLSIKYILNIWTENITFIINKQIKDFKFKERTIEHKYFIEYQSPYISLSKARNSLSKIARKNYKESDYFIHIDDDSYIYDINLLIQSLLYLKTNNINCLIIGSICKPNLEPINKHIKNYKTFKNLNLLNHNSIMGSCICYGKDLIKKKIFFNEDFGLGAKFGGSEETELFFQAINHKIKIVYNPLFIVIHPPTFKNQYGFKKMFKYGFGRGALYKKYFYSNKIKMTCFFFVSIFCNLGLSFIGLLIFNTSYSTRNIALFIGKIYGFIKFKI